jgi:hypothetical protein
MNMMRPYFILVFYAVYYYSVGGSARSLRSNHVPHLDVDDFSYILWILQFESQLLNMFTKSKICAIYENENVYKGQKKRHMGLNIIKCCQN